MENNEKSDTFRSKTTYQIMHDLIYQPEQIIPAPHKPFAYHYTDLNGFISIIQNREFWISNVNFLNDHRELEDGIGICKKVIMQHLEKDLPEIQLLALRKVLEKLESGRSDGSWAVKKSDIFSMSFCSIGDLLPQWRGYGRNAGVSIGFNLSAFGQCKLMELIDYKIIASTNPYEMHPEYGALPLLQPVIYDDDAKKHAIKVILAYFINMLEPLRSTDSQETDLEFNVACSEITDVIFRYIVLFKDKSFFSEEELRYVYTIFSSSSRRPRIDFRERNGIILPYIKFKLLDKNCHPLIDLPISDIIVGPCLQQDYLIDSIKYFLQNSGNQGLANLVRASKIPFRG